MLPYSIPFSVDSKVSEIISAALKRYAKAFDGDTLDIKAMRDDGAEIEDLLDQYLEKLQNGGNIIEMFGNMNIETTMKLLEPYAARMPEKTEVLDFYGNFYDNELENTRRQLQSESIH